MIWLNKREKYTGQWVNNLQEGKGVYTWYDGKNDMKCFNNRFVGEWKKGKRNGYGVFYYSNGTKYEGIWVDNQKDGFGVLTFQDGSEYIGLFKLDVLIDLNSPILLEKIEAEIAAEIQALKPKVVSPRRQKEVVKKPTAKKLLGNILESIVETDQKSSNPPNGNQSVNFSKLAALSQSLPTATEPTQTKPIKKAAISPLEKSLNCFEIYLNIPDLNKISPDIGASAKEIGNLLLRNLSEIKRWYLYSFRPELSEGEEIKEKKDTVPSIPACIYSNNLAYGMELKDLWRFLREVGTITPSFSIADFNELFFTQYNNYIEMFFMPEECEGNEIYEYLYHSISNEKRLFADHYTVYTGYYLSKDAFNKSLSYLKDSESKAEQPQSKETFLNLEKSINYSKAKSIHNEQQIVLLRQFYDALIRCAYLKYFTKDIPFSQKFRDYLMECSSAKPNLKRALRDKPAASKLESSFMQKEMKQSNELAKARNMEYLMIDQFFDLFKRQLTPIFHKLYFTYTDNGNENSMSIPYRFFYSKVIQRSKLFREIGIDKLRFAEFITFSHKDKRQLSGEDAHTGSMELFAYIEELFDNSFIFFEFCELVFFLTRKYIVRKRLKEEDNEEHSLEIINHIWSLVKSSSDKPKGRKAYEYPTNSLHAEIERLLLEQKEYENLQMLRNKEVDRYTMERNKMANENSNAYIPDIDEEDENSDGSEM